MHELTKKQLFRKLVYKKAEVTVFLSLICLVMCGFIAALLYSARESYIRLKAEAVTDLSIRSAFSEYDKWLFDEFGLLYVDTTYKGSEEGGDDCLANHIAGYVGANLSEGNCSANDLSLISVSVQNSKYADISEYSEEFCEFIEYDVREHTNEYFSFDYLLESAQVTVYYEGPRGKVYECTKNFSLADGS